MDQHTTLLVGPPRGPKPVALDAMGGDLAPSALVEGAIRAHQLGYPVVLVGDAEVLRPLLPDDSPIEIAHAGDVIGMGERAGRVLRRPDASVNVAVQAVRDGRACAVVSCGHTGAAMAAALFGLGRTPGVTRPALSTVVPRADGGQLVLLDLGANVDCKPDHLREFALMGHALARSVLGQSQPRVGLLSNGEESGKGNDLVRRAEPLLEALPIRYVGPVEPQGALSGACDVAVCDGFVGNIMLKSVEATAAVVAQMLREEIERLRGARVGAWLLRGALERFRVRTDHAAVGGAMLLGVEGVVVVGHGRSDARAVVSAIRHAHHCAAEDLSARVAQVLADAQLESSESDAD